jgi:hypothetical protein
MGYTALGQICGCRECSEGVEDDCWFCMIITVGNPLPK